MPRCTLQMKNTGGLQRRFDERIKGRRGAPAFLAGLKDLVVREWTQDRLDGLNRRGERMDDRRAERKGEYAGKRGPTLAPSGRTSRLIKNFRGWIRGTVLSFGWTGDVRHLAAAFRDPSRNPSWDARGLSPRIWGLVRREFNQFNREGR